MIVKKTVRIYKFFQANVYNLMLFTLTFSEKKRTIPVKGKNRAF